MTSQDSVRGSSPSTPSPQAADLTENPATTTVRPQPRGRSQDQVRTHRLRIAQQVTATAVATAAARYVQRGSSQAL